MADGLAGVTVVVARPRAQAPDLVALIESAGGRVVAVPLIEIVDLDAGDRVDRAVAGLSAADWIVVSSGHAANVLVSAPAFAACAARVAAVGPATASALGRADLVPRRNSAAGVVDELPRGPGRAVLLQAAGGAPTLADGLSAKGWTTTRIDTHVSRPVVPSAAEQLALLKADAVAFTSGSQARSWAAVLGAATPPVVAAIGPQTADDARAVGIDVTIVAGEHSLAGVVAALQHCFAR
jgi:uroporphyrinogen-III synthase